MTHTPPGRRRRSDAERSRARIVAVATRHLAEAGELDMSRLAEDAGVSRSTLYRHFPNADAVRAAVLAAAGDEATAAVHAATGEERPPLAVLREVISGLVAGGTRYALSAFEPGEVRALAAAVAPVMVGVVRGVAVFAGLRPELPGRIVEQAAGHLAETALTAARAERDANAAATDLFDTLTERLDQGLVLLDADGRLIAVNALAARSLALGDARPGQEVTSPRAETFYEDGSPSNAEAYPLAQAVLSGRTQAEAVRGHDVGGTLRWFAVSAIALRRSRDEGPYAVLGMLSDITRQKRVEASQLQPPGRLGREEAVPIDVARVLDKVPAQLLPEQLVAEARRLVEVPVALYVVDIDGTRLFRLAGPEEFPPRLEAPLALGPELAEDGIPDLRLRLAEELPGVVLAPMWLRGRAVGVLLAVGGDGNVLAEVARQGAPAMELANGYTDVFDARRRRKEINPAAEIQQSLLPPRIVRLTGAEIASGMLPSYDVGGDWIDYVENRDGAWIAIADAAGRGPRAAALGSIGLAALRAARRNEQNLEETVQTVHETMCDAGGPEFFLTAVVARWSPVYGVFSWVNAGHPPPLLLPRDGGFEQLATEPDLPLGLLDKERTFRRHHRRLEPGDRVVLHTDGISARPTKTGLFGIDGIVGASERARGQSASASARAIQEAVLAASERALRDDAAVAVLLVDGR